MLLYSHHTEKIKMLRSEVSSNELKSNYEKKINYIYMKSRLINIQFNV